MLTPIEQALPQWLSQATVIPREESVALTACCGRVLARAVISPIDVPPWNNSAMDGYAVQAHDIEAEIVLPQSQYITAGQAPEPLLQGTCARIFTGAPMPPHADTVVMQENTAVVDGKVKFLQGCERGENVRHQGQDMRVSQPIFDAGRCLSAADVGVLAALGVSHVCVRAKPRVALISSGDELVEPGDALPLGKIYNSNAYTLRALLERLGCDITLCSVVNDTLGGTREALLVASQHADLVISSGGASVGDADYVYQVLQTLGAVHTWKLAIKPGKPLMFGDIQGVPFFGLPGNPSSAFVTFIIAVLPFLEKMQQCRQSRLASSYAVADFDWCNAGRRQEYLRARTYFDGVTQKVSLYPNQSSGVVLSTAWANAFVVVPIGQTFEAGTVVEVIPLPV